MRALFIFAGISLLQQLHWIIYVFGALLIFTGIKWSRRKTKRFIRKRIRCSSSSNRLMPVTEHYQGDRFLSSRPTITPPHRYSLCSWWWKQQTSSLPWTRFRILAITVDPLIVYTSNVFAILGLPRLYFALAGVIGLFHYLHYGLSAILVFVGAKMLLADIYKLPVGVALGVVAGILLIAVVASVMRTTPGRSRQRSSRSSQTGGCRMLKGRGVKNL